MDGSPTNLTVGHIMPNLTMDPCVPYYILKYKKATAATWTTVYNPTSPYQFCNTTNSNANYVFTLQASCSPNHVSDTAYRAIGGLSHGCAKIERDEEDDDYLLSVFPNPASESFEVAFQLSTHESSEMATITILNQVGIVQKRIRQPLNENGYLSIKISANDFSSGVYCIRATVSGKSFQSKLLLQKE